MVPGIYDPSLADEDVRVGTEEAYEMTRRLAQEEGLLVGISSGANLAGALKVAAPGRRDRRGVLRRRREVPVRALLGEPARRRLDLRDQLMAGLRLTAALTRPSARTARDVSARMLRRACSAATASCTRRTRCRTPPKKGRGAASWCGRDDYRGAEKRAREAGLELLGFYHSHPDHPARPSQYDLDHAWPSFSYVIVSVMAGEDKLLTSWRLKEDRSAFDEEPVEITMTDPNDDQDSDSDPAAPVHRQAGRRRGRAARRSASCCRT